MNRIKNTKAFTLIELVVVIVILGILAAIAAFAYQNFISNARANSVQRKADQVAKSVQGASASKQRVLTQAEVQAVLDAELGTTNPGVSVASNGNVTVTASNTACTITLVNPSGPGDKWTRNPANGTNC